MEGNTDDNAEQDTHDSVEHNTHDNVVSPSKKTATNRRNAQLSTGPKTEEGKSRSRQNALKHGILASYFLITEGTGAEDPAEFNDLLDGLIRDRAPVGALEELLVHKIALCCWRERRAQRCEAGLIRQAFAKKSREDFTDGIEPAAGINDHLTLPSSADLDRILRYEAAIHRQMVHAINQLERLQRARKGEHIPEPVSVQLSSDQLSS